MDVKEVIFPEFPTGNGKIDLLLQYNNMTRGIELKSFSDQTAYKVALAQAAQYANRLGIRDIYLVSFIESIDDANKKKYETPFQDTGTGVTVYPVFIQTGKPSCWFSSSSVYELISYKVIFVHRQFMFFFSSRREEDGEISIISRLLLSLADWH